MTQMAQAQVLDHRPGATGRAHRAHAFVALHTEPPSVATIEHLALQRQWFDVLLVVDAQLPAAAADACARHGVRVVEVPLVRDQVAAAGFCKSTLTTRKDVTSWDAALWALREDAGHAAAWLVEHDVLLGSPGALSALDARYNGDPTADLLCALVRTEAADPGWPNWKTQRDVVRECLPPEATIGGLRHGMMCACRVSRALLRRVAHVASSRGRLVFHEIMLPTLAASVDGVAHPPELATVSWRDDVLRHGVRAGHVYHPVKEPRVHAAVAQGDLCNAPPLLPRMTDDECRSLCHTLLSLPPSRGVFEWGSGGSTLLWLRLGLPRVTCVECDGEHAERVRAVAHAYAPSLAMATCLQVVHVDLGATTACGPADAARRDAWLRYHGAWDALRGWQHAGAVIVGGRFRVACVLRVVLSALRGDAAPGTRLLVHDWERQHYHAVLPWVHIVQVVGRFVWLRVREDGDASAAQAAFDHYAYDPR